MSIRFNIRQLCHSKPADMAAQLERPALGSWTLSAMLIVVGCAAYGFSLGLGRAPLMGIYVAIKLPLLIFLTLSINALLNGILAQVLGSGLSFRQTWSAILRSFALFSLIVGSLAPVATYFTLNADFPGSYSTLLLVHVLVIAAAGIVANVQLYSGLRIQVPQKNVARNVLMAWRAGNLFVGAQFSYLLRPFFGQPALDVQLFRPDAFVGNFYSAVWSMSKHLLGEEGLAVVLAGLLFIFLLCIRKHTNPNRN